MIQEEKKIMKRSNNIIMENRHLVSVSGVIDVESFDEQSIVLNTDLGILTIAGENLHINKLNVENGDMNIEGDIGALMYHEAEEKHESIFSKLFR